LTARLDRHRRRLDRRHFAHQPAPLPPEEEWADVPAGCALCAWRAADKFFGGPAVAVGPPEVRLALATPDGGVLAFYLCRACLPTFRSSCRGSMLQAASEGLDYLRHRAAQEHLR
jgi:hypothetical protein